MKNIFLLRHGQTDWNKKHKLQGQIDIPLSLEGIKQINAIKDKMQEIKIDVIYSSPLSRAINTLKIIYGEDIDIKIEEGLSERYFGSYEGYSSKEIYQDTLTKKNPLYDGETMEESAIRFEKTLLKIIDETKEDNILICSHGGIIANFMNYCYNKERKGRILDIERLYNCALIKIEYDKIFNILDENII